MEEIAEALDARDTEAFKKMFSSSALEAAEELDQQITDLFEFYQGEMVSYKGDASSSTSTNYGVETKEFIGHYTLITDEQTYRLQYDHKPIDDEHPEEIGLRKLEIVPESTYEYEGVRRESFNWLHYDNGPGVYFQE